LFLAVLILIRRPIGDYSDPDDPFYEGVYSDAPDPFDGSIRIVSWNLHHADKLAEAIVTLENAEVLQDTDVLLLQQVNLIGVEKISRELHYNYVYYPAAIHRQRREEIGNAILAKWPLNDPVKIVLPNWLPGWLESRNAARARLSIGGRDILVYSFHMDMLWMVPGWVKSQAEFLVEATKIENAFVILGGDFSKSPVHMDCGLSGPGALVVHPDR